MASVSGHLRTVPSTGTFKTHSFTRRAAGTPKSRDRLFYPATLPVLGTLG